MIDSCPIMSEQFKDLPSDTLLDTQGLNCPEPVMMLHQAIRKSPSGTVIKVLATDPSTTRDIPKFCLHLGHELVDKQQQVIEPSTLYVYWVKKG